ncbi:unnamed protein product [Ambrosiozyma monospora]|uniref:Unnamed protein product n=1 Tax=Ambrosiozyma monospora TaxID=43982 RepID=A0ACB5TE87_AMBMO|nr:unnamed protein product [Ambrosiozyma monospora]
MNPDNMLKKSGVSDSDPNSEALLNVLESSADLFRMYRNMLTQLSKLSNGAPLIKLARTFGKYLDSYESQVLKSLLPDNKTLLSGTISEQDEAIDIICLVLNTADYCSITIGQLEERMISLLNDEKLVPKINFEKQTNLYLNEISKCMGLMYLKIENDLQLAWREMSNFNWKTLKDITGESRYLHSIKGVLKDNCQLIIGKFNRPLYIRNFIDKLIEIILNDLMINMVKLRPITGIMAEQLLLDLQTLKSFFLELPEQATLGSPTNLETMKATFAKNYKKFVSTKVDKIDKLLKILMTPMKPSDAFVINYFKIIGDRSFANFVKVLKLKGKLQNESTFENDKFKYMDLFRTQLRSYQESKLTNGTADGDDELVESDPFLNKLSIDPPIASSNTSSMSQLLLSSPTASTNLFAPSGSGSNSPKLNLNQNFLVGQQNLSNLFDRQSLQTTRDNLEKNFAKTFSISEDNKKNLNENLKQFGKFFKKN